MQACYSGRNLREHPAANAALIAQSPTGVPLGALGLLLALTPKARAPEPEPLMQPQRGFLPAQMKGASMLTALVLICSVAITPDLQACSDENAQSVIRVPTDDGSPVGCLLHGQAYLAETEIGQDLAADERVKVVCAPSQRAAAMVSRPSPGARSIR